MTRTLAFLLALAATPVLASSHGQGQGNGQGNPGAHFIENWDVNEDGQVTLEEATARRGDVFFTFDADENGVLDSEEHDLFDEARANDMKENGMGHGRGRNNPANGMMRNVTDADGDGQVTRAEFMEAVPAWFANMDRNGDGVVTTDDFGRGRN
ncbi:EF-hand domain-containing protein [Primorskyibacter aestuariivivens]|uniref:EF-hand domain-containing protein n=1 Tax=Primorskyibacter aestuariivivens TaxID=1888912 RepID=UPI0023014F79|nr:EF-hand domain-containing protein [Primorskyibacter aestuariivivens]MDA7427283.1 EF-hand domain-containing protein [Primorskyibacter aestuariivivens]